MQSTSKVFVIQREFWVGVCGFMIVANSLGCYRSHSVSTEDTGAADTRPRRDLGLDGDLDAPLEDTGLLDAAPPDILLDGGGVDVGDGDTDLVDTGPADAGAPDVLLDAGDLDAGDMGRCGSAPPLSPLPTCVGGEFLPRGAPLNVLGWQPFGGHGGVSHTDDGWGWLGRVRDSPGSPRVASYRLVRSDEHFTTLDTTSVVEGPITLEEQEWGVQFLTYLPCDERWLILYRTSTDATRMHGSLLDRNGRTLIGPVLLTEDGGGGGGRGILTDDEGGGFFLTGQIDHEMCSRQLSLVRLDTHDLSTTRGPAFRLEGYRQYGFSRRATGDWVVSGNNPCDAETTAPITFWTLSLDGLSPPRPVTGLPRTGPTSPWFPRVVPPRGPAMIISWSLSAEAPAVMEVQYAPVDPDSAAVVAPPVVIARVENVISGRASGGAQESESSWALTYTADYAGHLATRPTWFVRFNMEGEIIQRTELSATLGRGGAFIQWVGNHFIASYSGPGPIVEELICVRP